MKEKGVELKNSHYEQEGEMERSIRGAMEQNIAAYDRLVELHLAKVVDIAKTYHALAHIEEVIHREIKAMLDEESNTKEKTRP